MSDLLARLIADGTAPELVAEVAMLLAEKKLAESTVADRRAKDRERQARRRSRDVTECHVTKRDSVTDPSLSRPLSPQTPHTPTHTHPDITPRARKGGDFPMLDCTDADTWADFLRNRKAKRLPNTATARRKLESDLAEVSARTGWPPGEVFAACVAKGWGAIYDPRETTNDRPKQRPSTARETTGETAYRIAAELSQGPGSGEARTYR